MWSSICTAIKNQVVISAIPLAIVVVLGGYLSYRYNMILKDNRDLVVHTHEVISSVEHAFSDIKDAETGQRGFIITGDAKYLEPYERAVYISPESLGKVRRLVADRADQLDRLGDLEVALRDKLNELNATIWARRNKGFEAAREAIAQADGKATMDRIRAIVALMTSTEQELLADRTGRVARDERNVLLIAVLAAVASIITRIVVGFTVHRWRGGHEVA
ncbi:CHASE3 domain-containing protein [Bradyrhizobium sp. USDA 4502]